MPLLLYLLFRQKFCSSSFAIFAAHSRSPPPCHSIHTPSSSNTVLCVSFSRFQCCKILLSGQLLKTTQIPVSLELRLVLFPFHMDPFLLNRSVPLNCLMLMLFHLALIALTGFRYSESDFPITFLLSKSSKYSLFFFKACGNSNGSSFLLSLLFLQSFPVFHSLSRSFWPLALLVIHSFVAFAMLAFTSTSIYSTTTGSRLF